MPVSAGSTKPIAEDAIVETAWQAQVLILKAQFSKSPIALSRARSTVGRNAYATRRPPLIMELAACCVSGALGQRRSVTASVTGTHLFASLRARSRRLSCDPYIKFTFLDLTELGPMFR